MKRILGTCSICGGRVTVPTLWLGVVPPEPACESCGARARDHGPVIEMQRSVTRAADEARVRTAQQFVDLLFLGKTPNGT